MTVLGTYELPNGEWQTLAQFESEQDARECLSFHAQGGPVKLFANCAANAASTERGTARMAERLSALDMIRRFPPGRAVFGRESIDRGPWEITWYLREETSRINALGEAPDVEFRAAGIDCGEVFVIAVVVRVGPETPESVYETWLNHYADPGTLPTIRDQERLVIHLIGDDGQHTRTLQIGNHLADFARSVLPKLAQYRP